MSKLTERILYLKFVRILKFVNIREFQEFLKLIKFEFSICVLKCVYTQRYNINTIMSTTRLSSTGDVSSLDMCRLCVYVNDVCKECIIRMRVRRILGLELQFCFVKGVANQPISLYLKQATWPIGQTQETDTYIYTSIRNI